MLKKIFIFLCVFNIFALSTIVKAENLKLTPNAKSSILIDASSKNVLYANNEKERLFPASTTKIMTMILLFEAIDNKRIKWDDVLTCSAYASSMGGSQIYLEEGEKMSVEDLFKAISIASANDACVMVGERIAGSNDAFVSMMNEKAKALKLENTNFTNATGLHDDNHYTCAYDLAIMAAHLIEIGGDKLLQTSSLYDSYIREDSPQKFWLVNTNKLLKSYDGCDGLKTGYTSEAGYCIVTTAKREGLRLIGVVLKESEPKVRNQEISQLMDYGFSLYENITIFKKNLVIERIKVNHAKVKYIEVISKEDITYTKDKSKNDEYAYTINYIKKTAPIDKEDVIGYLMLYKNNENIASFKLYSLNDIEALSFLEKTYLYFYNII
mgnify:CR=1 FL=1